MAELTCPHSSRGAHETFDELAETCALDVADRETQKHPQGESREVVGDLCNMTGQRITTLEREAIAHLRVVYGVDEPYGARA
jgi:hypothetical protein